MAFDQPVEDRRRGGADGHEEPEFPGDDLVGQAVGLQPLAHARGEAEKLDAMVGHDAHAAKLEPVGELQVGLALDEERQSLSAVELRNLVEAEIAVRAWTGPRVESGGR